MSSYEGDPTPLNDRELQQLRRLLSDPFSYPPELWNWIKGKIEEDPPATTWDSILGFSQAVSREADTKSRVLLRKTAPHTYGSGGAAPGGNLVWDVEAYDLDNMHDQTTNPDRITIQRTGLYLFVINLKWAASAVGNRGAVLGKNGAPFQQSARAAANPTAGEVSSVTLVGFDIAGPGDYYTVLGYQTSGANLNVLTGDGGLGGNTEFGAIRLGS